LGLKPWQLPVCDFFYERDEIDDLLAAGPGIDVITKGQYVRATLAKRLLATKLSLFEPDPPRALDDDEYRKAIDARVRTLTKRGLTDEVIEHVMKLAPYPLFRPTYERREEQQCRSEFLELLSQQPIRNFDACAKAMRMTWKAHRERTRVY
jgi:hypothetical protein